MNFLRTITIVLSLLLMLNISFAEISNLKLSQTQVLKLSSFDYHQIKEDTLGDKKFSYFKQDSVLSKLQYTDLNNVLYIINPKNSKVYKDSSIQYNNCKLIANELCQKIFRDIASEDAEEKIMISQYLHFEKGIYFNQNLTSYLQNLIFDFYFNNNVLNALNDIEYLKILKPKAVYKLLVETYPNDKLKNEILFIANNSKYKLFK